MSWPTELSNSKIKGFMELEGGGLSTQTERNTFLWQRFLLRSLLRSLFGVFQFMSKLFVLLLKLESLQSQSETFEVFVNSTFLSGFFIAVESIECHKKLTGHLPFLFVTHLLPLQKDWGWWFFEVVILVIKIMLLLPPFF